MGSATSVTQSCLSACGSEAAALQSREAAQQVCCWQVLAGQVAVTRLCCLLMVGSFLWSCCQGREGMDQA